MPFLSIIMVMHDLYRGGEIWHLPRFLPLFRHTLPTFMPHKKFVLAYYNGPLGCLINTPKALGILLVHEIHDSRLRLFLLKWVAALILLLGAGIRGFI